MNTETRLALSILEYTLHNRVPGLKALLAADKIDWKKFKEFIKYHELITFAYPLFKEYPSLFPLGLMDTLKKTYYHTIIRNQERWGEFLRIARVFKSARVPLVPIKGLSLLEDIYSENSIRPMSDIDLLVKEEDLRRAERLFDGLGYSKDLDGLKQEYWLKAKCQLLFRKKSSPGRDIIELHFNFDYKKEAFSIVEQAWKRIRQVWVGADYIDLLSPEDNLFSLVLHQRVRGKSLSLKYVLDAGLLLKRYGPSFDWGYLLRAAKEAKVEASLYFLLSTLDICKIGYVPEAIYKQLPVPHYKRRLSRAFIKKNTFLDDIAFKADIIYLKSLFLLYDNIWRALANLINPPHEHFAKFYSFKPYSRKAYFFYHLRFFVFLKSLARLVVFDSG